jgi:hypothetical protein
MEEIIAFVCSHWGAAVEVEPAKIQLGATDLKRNHDILFVEKGESVLIR